MSEIGTNVSDPRIAEIERLIREYKATPQAEQVVGAFDFTFLLTLIPMILQFFVKDEALRTIITKVVELLTGLWKQ